MNIKSGNRTTTNEYWYFLESNFVGVNRSFLLVYSNQRNHSKGYSAKKYYLPKGTIKYYKTIINGKKVYEKPTDSDINQYEEISKLTTRKGKIISQGSCCIMDTSKTIID